VKHARPADSPDLLADAERHQRRLDRECAVAARHGGNPYRKLNAVERVEAHRPGSAAAHTTSRPRPRGAGRPARRAAARSSARSGDSGSDDPPPPAEPPWRFGDGQTAAQEQAEIAAAQAAGRTDEYMAAQQAARQRARSQRWDTTHSRALPRRANAEPCPCLTDRPDDIAEDPEQTYMAALLADHERGAINPEPVALDLPTGTPSTVARVADDVALLIGLRLAVGDSRPLPYAVRWRARDLGLSPATVGRALVSLVSIGALDRGEPMPPLPGRSKGTATYLPPNLGDAHGGSDGVPVSRLEARPVAVEAERVGAPGLAVEPTPELPHKPGVRDAVGGRAGLHRVLAPERGTEDHPTVGHVGSVGHAPTPYAWPTTSYLLDRALADARPGTRNATGLWLACQLRDHGTPELEADAVLAAYAGRVPPGSHPYTVREAWATVRTAYRRSPRDPWSRDRRDEP
jgi:hypothetical protein